MKAKEPLTQLVDSTAAKSWKMWQECGRRLQEQYDLGLMPPPPAREWDFPTAKRVPGKRRPNQNGQNVGAVQLVDRGSDDN
jgi:hypothetical protein